MAASHYKLENLVLIVDRNGYQSNDRGTEAVMAIEPLHEKLRAFGFAVKRVNGHDIGELLDALDAVPFAAGMPSALIAHTVKGKGVSFLEARHAHCGRFGRDFESGLLSAAIQELEGTKK
jgi:transketolase